MKNSEIQIGSVYIAKVTGKPTRVRIDSTVATGGWKATNLLTNRQVRIKTARRLTMTPESVAKAIQANAAFKEKTEPKPFCPFSSLRRPLRSRKRRR